VILKRVKEEGIHEFKNAKRHNTTNKNGGASGSAHVTTSQQKERKISKREN